MPKLNIYPVVVGFLQTNCYLVADESGRDAVVIDPGAKSSAIMKNIDRMKLNPKYILLTHGHHDHTGGVADLKRELVVPVLLHEEESDFIRVAASDREPFDPAADSSKPYLTLRDEDEIVFGAARLKTLHTPGHTPGGVCFLEADAGVAFTGDTLFNDGVGRTDFPGGSAQALDNSIRSKLLVLPDDTVIFPGHGPSSTIGRERRYF